MLPQLEAVLGEAVNAVVLRVGPTISDKVLQRNRGSIMGRLEVASRTLRELTKDGTVNVSVLATTRALVGLMMQDPAPTVDSSPHKGGRRNSVIVNVGDGDIEVAIAAEQPKRKGRGKDFVISAVNLSQVKRRAKSAHRPPVWMSGLEDEPANAAPAEDKLNLVCVVARASSRLRVAAPPASGHSSDSARV